MSFVDLIFHMFWDSNSYCNVRALSQLSRSALQLQVSSDVKHNFQRCNAFLEEVLSGYIVECAMSHFGVTNITDEITSANSVPLLDRKQWLQDEMAKIVDCLITPVFWISVTDLTSYFGQL